MSRRKEPRAAAAAPRALEEFIEGLAAAFVNADGFVIQNSPDPEQGVVDRAAALRVMGEPDARTAQLRLKQLRQADPASRSAGFLMDAVRGSNRDEVLKGVQQRVQLAVKAYGLLPLAEGEAGRAECLARYLALQKYARESHRFGPRRQANERAAVRVALANLAQTASLGEVAQLEREMEARLAEQAAHAARKCGEFRLELAGAGLAAEVRAARGGKPLGSAPASLRKNPAYVELRALADELRFQHSRFRAALEVRMIEGEFAPAADWKALYTLPTVRGILDKLVFQDEGGVFGLFDPETGTLDSGHAKAPVAGRLRVTHPHHLQQAGCLTVWQREIVRRRIVQPFKQIFRELYLAGEADFPITRFAGCRVTFRHAARTLLTRGWLLESRTAVVARREFPAARLEAVWRFSDEGPFLEEPEVITAAGVTFRASAGKAAAPGEEAVATAVPPVVHSEVMRDCDAVCAEAAGAVGGPPTQPTGEDARGSPSVSPERLQRRAELLSALVADLGREGVAIEGGVARIQGRLAAYSLDLTDGSIRIEPSGHSLAAPERWGARHPELYLPFPALDDPPTAEVLGRALWLLDDDRISDAQVLKQARN